MEFNKQAHIVNMQPSVDKLLTHLDKKGIKFSSTDGDMNNVIFTFGNQEIKISHHSFYRYSGICCVSNDKGGNMSEYVEVTDEMFVDKFMKPIVELMLGIK